MCSTLWLQYIVKWSLIDDYEPEWTGKAALKRWADRYPFQAEFKGGSTVMRPQILIITSNYKIEDAGFLPNDVIPIMNRFIQCNANQFKIFIDNSVIE